MPERPDSLTLVPGEAGGTDPVHRPRVGWDAGGRLHLGLPILQFTVDELLDDQRFGLFSSILEYWVLNDLRNILRQQRCWPCSWSGTWFPARTLTEAARIQPIMAVRPARPYRAEGVPRVTASRTVTGPFDAILAELAQRIQNGETGTIDHET